MARPGELPYHTAQSGGAGCGMFHTAAGKLQRQLHQGEFDIFKHAPIFESDFIQVTKRGEVIDVHNRVRMVTVAVASTSPLLPMPDVMLLARPAASLEDRTGRPARAKGHKGSKAVELTRLLPLKFVRLSVHDRENQQLRLKLATGRSCYLQLCPAQSTRDNLFAHWEKLTYLLRPPVDSHSGTYALPAGDMVCVPGVEEETGVGEPDCAGWGDQDQVSVRSLHGPPEVAGATSAAFSGGQGLPQEPPKPIHVHYGSTSDISLADSPDPAAGARRERREKDRTLRTGHHRPPESRHTAAGDKTPRKLPSGRSLASRRASRDDRKDRGHGSLAGSGRGSGHKGPGHAPATKESRASRKPAGSLPAVSSGPTTKTLGRVGSFLQTVKDNLATRALASPRGRDPGPPPRPAGELSTEAIEKPAGSPQGPQAAGGVPLESADPGPGQGHP
ncbi:PREDICTED: protein FAM71A [Condylura cristata]|uniref:protein FAM71A n=1 Tax=Condylura cristata TaxID=143302 RepID=UPI0003344EF9|nr:PREDICTED: protein FAM71A [Condylura cristata]